MRKKKEKQMLKRGQISQKRKTKKSCVCICGAQMSCELVSEPKKQRGTKLLISETRELFRCTCSICNVSCFLTVNEIQRRGK